MNYGNFRKLETGRESDSDEVVGPVRLFSMQLYPWSESEVTGKFRSGQVYYSAEVQDHEGQAKKTFES